MTTSGPNVSSMRSARLVGRHMAVRAQFVIGLWGRCNAPQGKTYTQNYVSSA